MLSVACPTVWAKKTNVAGWVERNFFLGLFSKVAQALQPIPSNSVAGFCIEKERKEDEEENERERGRERQLRQPTRKLFFLFFEILSDLIMNQAIPYHLADEG